MILVGGIGKGTDSYESIVRGEDAVAVVVGGLATARGDVRGLAGSNGSFFKNNFWYPLVPDYVDLAFQAARKVCGKAWLCGIAVWGTRVSNALYILYH